MRERGFVHFLKRLTFVKRLLTKAELEEKKINRRHFQVTKGVASFFFIENSK